MNHQQNKHQFGLTRALVQHGRYLSMIRVFADVRDSVLSTTVKRLTRTLLSRGMLIAAISLVVPSSVLVTLFAPTNTTTTSTSTTSTISTLLAPLSPQTAHAQTPNTTMNFQARILNASGSLVPDGNYHIEFKIYDDISAGATAQGSCSGNCLWMETRTTGNLVRVVNGYISVNLGSVTAFGSTMPWSQNLYITMRVGGSAGAASWDTEMTNTGNRMKLNTAPLAFIANNVRTSNRNTASTNSDNITIQTGNATGTTSNSGNISIDTGTATSTTGTITLGATNASALTLGRAGLTTTNSGALTVTQAFIGNSTGLFQNTANSTTAFRVLNSGGSSTVLNVDTSNVRVGIGTSAPAAALSVSTNQSSSAWGTSGIGVRISGSTYTDTSSSGTVASAVGSSFGQPTFAANSVTTYTDSANLYIAGAPVAGTNVTLTNRYALFVDANTARFDGVVELGNASSTAGDLRIYDTNGQYISVVAGNVTANRIVTIPVATGSDTFCLASLGNCFGSGSGGTLQAAYNAGNTLTTTDNRDIAFTLADTATDSDFIVNVAAGSTGGIRFQYGGVDALTFDASNGLVLGDGASVFQSSATYTTINSQADFTFLVQNDNTSQDAFWVNTNNNFGAHAYYLTSQTGIDATTYVSAGLASNPGTLYVSDGDAGAGVSWVGITTPSQSADYNVAFPVLSGNTTFCLASGNCSATGTAGGALAGTYPNPTLSGVSGTGAVPFQSSTTGVLATDSTNFVFDDATNRLRIGGGANIAGETLTVTTGTGYGIVQSNGTVSMGTYVDGSNGWFGTQSNHDLLFFTNNASETLKLDNAGYVGVGTTVSPTTASGAGDLYIQDLLEIDGNTLLGDASSDTITFSGRVNSSILPSADDTYDLGSSGNRWRDLYLGPSSLHVYCTAGECTSARDWTLGVIETAGATQGNVRLGLSGASTLVVSTAGRVGIGQSNPAQALDVNGAVRSGIAVNAGASTPALRVSGNGGGGSTSNRPIAIKNDSDSDVRIFADTSNFDNIGQYYRNSDDTMHFTYNGNTGSLGSWTEYDSSGAAITTHSKVQVTLSSGDLTAGGVIRSNSGFNVSGTAGATRTCTGGQILQNQTVSGGIVTGGTCSTAGTGTVTGSGTANQVAYFAATGSAITSSSSLGFNGSQLQVNNTSTTIQSTLNIFANNASNTANAVNVRNYTGEAVVIQPYDAADRAAISVRNSAGGYLAEWRMTGEFRGRDSGIGYSFLTDTDMGMARTGADTLALYTANVARLTVSSAGDVSLSNSLTISGTATINSRVAIGDVSGCGGYAAMMYTGLTANCQNYAFMQSSAGATFVNASSGQSMYHRIANADKFTISSTSNTSHVNLSVSGVIYGQSSAGSGQVLAVGNDASIYDVDVAHTVGIYSASDSTRGTLRLGSSGGSIVGLATQTYMYSPNGTWAITADNAGIFTGIAAATANNHLCYGGFGKIEFCTSSQTQKHDITNTSYGLATLRGLRPVQYAWNADNRLDAGFIAEEVALVVPEAVQYNTDGSVKSFSMDPIVSVLASATQQLDVQVQSIDSRLSVLESGQFSGSLSVVNDIYVGDDLTVAGDAEIQGNLTVLGSTTVQKITVVAGIKLGGTVNQDTNVVTKMFKASEDLLAGEVVVLDSAIPGNVKRTNIAQDTKVIGIVTADANAGDDVEIAVYGNVQVRVQSTVTVGIGDLMTTSAAYGLSNSSASVATGSLIGKATSTKDSMDLVWVFISMQ